MTTRRRAWLLVATMVAVLLAVAPARAALSNEQLDQIVAPVALYPDALLAQVFIASTYPLEVVEADRWRKANASLTGDALTKALEEKDWDDSIKWLCSFPEVLDRMSTNLDWTQDMGNAFLDQQAGVMDAVQRMRAKAEASGALKTDKQQVVVKEKETIVIQPADPQVVYVPTYPPTVYGPTYVASPVYPAVYPPTATWGGALLTFGAGMATGAILSNAFDWNDHNCYQNNYYGGGHGHGHNNNNVNINKNVNINNANINKQKWQHNPEHRRGVGYKNAADTKRYGERDRAATRDRAQRDAGRGYGGGDRAGAGGGRQDRPGAGNRPDRPAAGDRPGAGGAGRPDRPSGGGGGGGRPDAGRPGGDRPGGGGGRPGGGDRPSAGGGGSRPGGSGNSGAFGNYGNGKSTREASNRGAASRNKPSYAGGGGGSRPSYGGGGGGGRGGGGGHGGGGSRGGGGRGGGGGGRGGGRGR